MDIQTVECDNDSNEAVYMKRGEALCQSCKDEKFGAWRDFICPGCGRRTQARKGDIVTCYNTVFHDRKGGMPMREMK